MTTYRSLQTIEAIQYAGEPIPAVTCSGEGEDQKRYGCTGLAGVPHVHTAAVGGAHRLEPGDWIFPVPKGGPFDVASNGKFRAYWEVPVMVPVMGQANRSQPGLSAGELMFSGMRKAAAYDQSSRSTGEEKESAEDAQSHAPGAEVSEQPATGETPLPVDIPITDQMIFATEPPIEDDGTKPEPPEVVSE